MQDQSNEQRAAVLKRLLDIATGAWPPEAATLGLQSKRLLPALLLGVGIAELRGKRLTKGEVVRLLPADMGSSGARCVEEAQKMGFVIVQKGLGRDWRRKFVVGTNKLQLLLEKELSELLDEVRSFQRDINDEWGSYGWSPAQEVQEKERAPMEVARALDEALHFLNAGAIEQAHAACRAVLERAPLNKRALLLQLEVCEQQKDWDGASDVCEKLLKTHRATPPFCLRYARILIQLNRITEARHILKSAIPNCSPDEIGEVERELGRLPSQAREE